MENNLSKRLEDIKKNSKISPTDKKVIDEGFQKIRDEKIIEKSLKTGQFPDFKLKTRDGSFITNDNFKDKNLIISFFRGSWCPYCKQEIIEYESLAKEFEKTNTKVVVVSPEKIEIINAKGLNKNIIQKIEVVEDTNNTLAKALGINFTLDEGTTKVYNKFGIVLSESQNNQENILPIPATYIIKNNEIKKVFANADYSKRAEPLEILEIIKTFKK